MLDCCSNVLFSLMVFPVFAQYFRKVVELLGNPTGKRMQEYFEKFGFNFMISDIKLMRLS